MLFRAESKSIELGYCFGADYIVVYRSGPDGDRLLGNSSDDSAPITLPADLQGRVHINNHQKLLGLQISKLTRQDSGMYRRECWQNNMRVSQQIQQLMVCDEEFNSMGIVQKEEGEVTELWCNHTSISQAETTVRWYREMFPLYKLTLFLDSSVSLDPLLEDLRGVVEVREGGALLLLHSGVLKDNHHFYCLVIREEGCLSFQNMFLPDNSQSTEVFLSRGDRAVLQCPAGGTNQQWDTPLGRLDANSTKNRFMFISSGEDSKDFSLVIPAASEEHDGDYSCISSTLELQYSLTLCPKKESEERLFDEGTSVTLHCNATIESFQRVQWYRLGPSGDHQLLQDTKDNPIPVPEDLIGRVAPSKDSSLLSIDHLQRRDGGRYWCLVLGVSVLLEEGDDYKEDYDAEYTVEDDHDNEHVWFESSGCILKKETTLILKGTGRVPDSPGSTDVTPYALGGVVALLVLGGVVAAVVFVMKKKAKEQKAEEAKQNMELGCTEKLNPNAENAP